MNNAALTKSEIKTLKDRSVILAKFLREETNPVAKNNLGTDLQVALNKLDPVILSIIADIKAESVITNDVERAARSIFRQRRDDCLEVLEIIGSWPASEYVLRALQRVDLRG